MRPLARLDLTELPLGRGRAHAPIVWIALAKHLSRRSQHTRVWPSNATISKLTACPLRAVEYGMAMLLRAGKISVHYGWRPGGARFGRIVTMHLLGDGPNPRIKLPRPAEMIALWGKASGQRERPATVVALALAAHVLAADTHGKIGRRCSIKPKLVQLQRLVGATAGQTFTARLDALARAGIIARAGELWREGIVVFGRWVTQALEYVRELALPALRRCRAPEHIEAWHGPPPDEYPGDGDWELVLEVG